MIGRHLAHYEILAKIGEGGMGEVYRARDPRLQREVAIKVLGTSTPRTEEARARFEREARAVAALSHPNILAIYDVGEHEGVAYAVTELLEGHTLFERSKEGPLPLRRALEIAAQVADGLAAAHDKGIVHRDVKPSNIFLTEDGRVKILDFGLAKSLFETEGDRTLARTVGEATAPGTVLGTVRYMSPEQVRAAEVDHRSDIFSFGAVLWETFGGRPPFDGDSAVEIMNAVLKEDPREWDANAELVPASVERILRRCLEKSPARRFQSAQDLAFALRSALDTSSNRSTPALDVPATELPRAERRPKLLLAIALLLAGALVGAGIGGSLRTPVEAEPVKVVTISHSGDDSQPDASPDGNTIAFVSMRDGRPRVWLRQRSGGSEAPLTEGVDYFPKFSPDGSSILFLRTENGMMSAYRVATVGGPPRKMMDNVLYACWAAGGDQIAFLRMLGPVESPEVMLATSDMQSGRTQELARFPRRFVYGLEASPDGRWFSVASTSVVQNTRDNRITLVDARTGETRDVWRSQTRHAAPSWTPDSTRLVFGESESLLGDISGALGRALSLDPFSGRAHPLFWIQSVWAGAVDYVTFDILDDGSLVFDEILWSSGLTEFQLGSDGTAIPSRTITRGNARDRQPVFAKRGSAVLFSSNRSGNLDLWSIDRDSGVLRQITDDAAEDWDPAFTVDGRSILWSSNRGGNLEIWMANADGSGARQLSNDGEDAENPTQTADGDWVVYSSGHEAHPGIVKIRTDGSELVRIADGSFLLPEVSPDGRYVSYTALDTERLQVELRVSDLETREVVFRTSIEFRGAQHVLQHGRSRWMPDGRTLVFTATGGAGEVGLFSQEFRPGEDTSATRRLLVRMDNDIESFGISPDGSRLVVSDIDHLRSLKIAEGVFASRP